MGNSQFGSGSQEGQGNTSGSQAGQGTGSQQSQGNGTGSQAGQGQQDLSQFRFDGQGENESLTDYVSRIQKDLDTARKQAAGYRQRLQGNDGNGQGQETGQNQGQNQQGNQGDLAAQLARIQRELDAERSQRRQEKVNSQLISALASAGAVNPGLSVRLVDLESLDIDENGNVSDPDAAVRSLKTAMPQLFTSNRGNGDGGAGNTGAGGATQDMNVLIRRRAGMRG